MLLHCHSGLLDRGRIKREDKVSAYDWNARNRAISSLYGATFTDESSAEGTYGVSRIFGTEASTG